MLSENGRHATKNRYQDRSNNLPHNILIWAKRLYTILRNVLYHIVNLLYKNTVSVLVDYVKE